MMLMHKMRNLSHQTFAFYNFPAPCSVNIIVGWAQVVTFSSINQL